MGGGVGVNKGLVSRESEGDQGSGSWGRGVLSVKGRREESRVGEVEEGRRSVCEEQKGC